MDVTRVAPGQKLELYISPSCPYCQEAIVHYEAQGIGFVVHDAQNDRSERAKMFAYTGGDPTVPVIVVDGAYVQSGWGIPPRG
ncbi:MAG: glutathione S-transferase N-terminal domain-containing protein [Candidatus Eremiobacteraeota bacterium]|nr:glutathione S-transferase N-terminal domain-containing protein [Candidatus Eremiobacteraeota bacterium]